ncbi:caspase Dronc-like [Anopheles moucheti]|uniref:caspase Dronc-like n=1 Tax=Anopheles moucheti TaxID=186751 RepID=UPI0022F0AE19|nr:caspase Dronc-like [Anopheles moucheti]
MDDKDRNIIITNLDELVNNTSYCALRTACIEQHMLSKTMASRIESTAQDERTRRKKLFEKITKRGPTAFETLLSICQQKFPIAYSILKPSSNAHLMHSTHNPQRVPSLSCNMVPKAYSHPSPDDDDVDDVDDCKQILQVYTEKLPKLFTVKHSTGPMEAHPEVQAYPMKSRKRGVAFIVNVINFYNEAHSKRNGANIDGRNLISLFQQLGFVVFYYEDITKNNLKKLLKQLKKSQYLSCDCFAFYILSHGEREEGIDSVFLHDSQIRVEDILAEFTTINCPRLIHKPKLFFISMCRGEQPDYGLLVNTERDGMVDLKKPQPSNIATYCDMLVCYATVPGFAAHRDTKTGSWFVESMCEVWSEHAHNTDVEMLMKLVGKRAANYRTKHEAMQTSSTEQRGFHKQLYLNPGYYENATEL